MTNPDNVGGLPELPAPDFMLRWDSMRAAYYVSRPNVGNTDVYTADQMRAYGELCRAAPAGGDGDWYTSDQGSHIVDFDQDSANQLSILLKRDGTVSAVTTRDGKRYVGGYGLDEVADVIRQWSAPAGSGEVEKLIAALERDAEQSRGGLAYLAKVAALLRKLQQGAE